MNEGPGCTDEVRSAAAHYETLLADHYSWMMGDFSDRVAECRQMFARWGIVPKTMAAALDLGCGAGIQSLALAQGGFRVTAVDTCRKLLDELSQRAGALPIRPVEADIAALEFCDPASVDVAVCMGDTLPHLPSLDVVSGLQASVYARLAPGGVFVVGFREQTKVLAGLDRFLPLRSDENRIMTCFLEYEPQSVIVHDLVYVREDGRWVLHKSCYRKLRLATDWVLRQLQTVGFSILRHETVGGMDVILAGRA